MRDPEEMAQRNIRNNYAIVPNETGHAVIDLRTNLRVGDISSETLPGTFKLIFLPCYRHAFASQDLVEIGLILVRCKGDSA